jgi:serine/threonine protein kinase
MKTCPKCGLVFPDESTFCFLTGDTLKQSADALVGTSVEGRFRLEALLAESPWARVYRGRHRLLVDRVVVKVWREPFDDAERERFREALRRARRCTHPNIVEPCGGGFTGDGKSWVAHSERDGTPLGALLARGPMPPARVAGITEQMLHALSRIHDFGGTHGDLRPTNVLVTSGAHAEVVDVGLGSTSRPSSTLAREAASRATSMRSAPPCSRCSPAPYPSRPTTHASCAR